jgi:TonB family protein
MADASSLLSGSDDRLGPYVGLALVAHLGVLGAIVAVQILFPEQPPSKPLIDVSMTVEAYDAVPKSDRLPERATRAAAPRAPTPEPMPTPTPEPVPVQQSEMKFQDKEKKPDPKQVGTDDPNRRVADTQRMKDLLADLDADPGPTDRNASSPDGTRGATGLEKLGRGDPEFARYKDQVSRIFRDEFRPLPALAGRGLKTVVLVRVDADWNVTERKLKTSSGNAIWDRTAMAAAEAVTKLPPAPEKYREAFLTHGYEPTFEDP